MWGGELFVPKIPSFKILDLAEAIERGIKTEEIGIRPGEKIHEEMITEADAMSTIQFEKYFVILPSVQLGDSDQLKLWDTEKFRTTSSTKPGEFCDYSFKYNSGTNEWFLSVDELRQLINSNVVGD